MDHENPKTPRLVMAGVHKAFGSTVALRGVSLSVAAGEVHALIGENGAGKSTLMKVLSGACAADAGSIVLDGKPFLPKNPLHARRAGIAMIHQELVLALELTVEQNILLGSERSRWGFVQSERCREAARQSLSRLGREDLRLDALVGDLSLADRQVVEIARALIGDPAVMVMDEATSSLGPRDAERLFRVVVQLKSLGVAVVYISHFLEECQTVCDRYTVLRDGETVGSGVMNEVTLPKLIRLMVGREVETLYPRSARTPGETVLRVRDLKGKRSPNGVSFELRRGEIFGVAGLVGAGRTETLRTVFGLDAMTGGSVEVGPSSTRADARRSGLFFWRADARRSGLSFWRADARRSGLSFWRADARRSGLPRQRLRQGIGLTSENRKDEGLLLNRSVADNLTMTRFDTVARLGFVSRRRQRDAAQRQIAALGIKAARPSQAVGDLSGGNQQKVALGRLLHHDADILLLDEPTRGIDVAAKAEIYGIITELARCGKAVVFVSSYLPELLGVCDTIGVMYRGRMAAIRPAASWTEHDVMAAALGQLS